MIIPYLEFALKISTFQLNVLIQILTKQALLIEVNHYNLVIEQTTGRW